MGIIRFGLQYDGVYFTEAPCYAGFLCERAKRPTRRNGVWTLVGLAG